MSSVAGDSNEIILKQVSGCRRRLLCLILIRAFAWSGTILITGMGLSRFEIPGMSVLTILISCFVAAYYLWHHYPRTNQVVRMIDERLSLKEGLVTAFQFRESQGRFVPLLINQISPRFTRASSRQIFPFKIPGVLLAWPFLLALMIVPVETVPAGLFSFHQSQMDMESLRADAGDPVQEGIVNSEGSAILSDSSPSVRMYPLQQGVSDNGGLTEKAESSIAGITEDDENNPPYSPFNKGGDSLSFLPPPLEKGGKGGFDQGPPDEMSMSQMLTKRNENPVRHPELVSGSQTMQGQEIPKQVRDDKKAIFPRETSMSLRLIKDDENTSSIPPATGSSKGREGKSGHYNETIHTAVVQILTRQDIPQDYKEYVKNYFDVIQKEGLDHGDE